MKRVYEERRLRRDKCNDVEGMEENEREDDYKNIKPLDNINPYCIFVSTKGALALALVTCFDKESSNEDNDYENWKEKSKGEKEDEKVRVIKENSNNEEAEEAEEEDSLGGFEKVRYDAPELKLGLLIIHFFFFFFFFLGVILNLIYI
jgi:hypothetical protein